MKDERGSVRTGIQEQSGSEVTAAGKRGVYHPPERNVCDALPHAARAAVDGRDGCQNKPKNSRPRQWAS